jgi:hypothetical protein
MFKKHPVLIGLAIVFLLSGANSGCDADQKSSATAMEQSQQNRQMEQFLRNQPVPSFDWSLERHMLIQLYAARQRATATYSVVQSEFTGKILWQCPSIGFPLPYSTQLTNPMQAVWHGDTHNDAGVAVGQQEPNGLFSPPSSEGTWVPCVDEKGKITPVYEEKHVTVFLRPVTEQNGQLVPTGAPASLVIDTKR